MYVCLYNIYVYVCVCMLIKEDKQEFYGLETDVSTFEDLISKIKENDLEKINVFDMRPKSLFVEPVTHTIEEPLENFAVEMKIYVKLNGTEVKEISEEPIDYSKAYQLSLYNPNPVPIKFRIQRFLNGEVLSKIISSEKLGN